MMREIIFIAISIFIVYCAWAIMKVSSDSNNIDYVEMIKASKERTQNQSDILSDDLTDLERETFNVLIEEFNKDKEEV